MIEREGLVSYKGKPITLVGENVVEAGEKIPPVKLSKSTDEDLELSELLGKVVVLNAIPSIDTPVCSNQTAKFNEEMGMLDDEGVLVSVSMDLPFAIQRWCRENNISPTHSTSDYKYRDYGKQFSLLMKGLGLLARSVMVVDREGVLRYCEIVKHMEKEPDYGSALAAVKAHL